MGRWVEPRSVLVAAVTSFALYVVFNAVLLPGGIDLVAAMPSAAQFGVLLLASSATRVLAGFLAARRFRAQRGLDRRLDALPSAALGAVLGWLLTVGSVAALGVAPLTWVLLVDALRWPVEAGLGGLLALPGEATDDPDLGWR